MRSFALSAALAVALAVSAAADDSVTITAPVLKAGDKLRVTKTEKTKVVESFEAGGQKTSKNKEETRLIAFTEEVLTAGAGDEKPAKMVRVYEKFDVKSDKAVPAPPLNTPITIAKKDGKYTFTADKPLGDFAKKLDEEFNKPDEPTTKDFLPGKPVKPGDSWKIDPTKFVKSLGQDKMTVDAAKSTMTAKLLKTYKKDGKLFGAIEVSFVFPLKDLGKDGPPLKSGVLTATGISDVCLDGTDLAESTKTQLGFEVVIEAKEVTLTVKSDGALTTTKEALPRK